MTQAAGEGAVVGQKRKGCLAAPGGGISARQNSTSRRPQRQLQRPQRFEEEDEDDDEEEAFASNGSGGEETELANLAMPPAPLLGSTAPDATTGAVHGGLSSRRPHGVGADHASRSASTDACGSVDGGHVTEGHTTDFGSQHSYGTTDFGSQQSYLSLSGVGHVRSGSASSLPLSSHTVTMTASPIYDAGRSDPPSHLGSPLPRASSFRWLRFRRRSSSTPATTASYVPRQPSPPPPPTLSR